MPRISAEREAATRRRILQAARKVFVEKGFHRASIDDVVDAAGLSVGAIYTYFPSKDELIRASILDNSERHRREQIQQATFQISEAVHTADDLDQLYRRIHSIIQGLMPARNFSSSNARWLVLPLPALP